MKKQRLDLLLVEQGLADSRTKAQALIMAGLVYHGQQKLDKAGEQLADDIELTVRGKEHPWVSRGGMKLMQAITEFSMDVAGLVAMDVGSSTGGFTDVLLTHGAAKVYAVDVGTGQLDPKIRNDPRVVVMEQTNARHLTAAMLAEADASFASPSGEATRLSAPALSRSGEGIAPTMMPSPSPLRGSPPSPEGRGLGILDLIVCDASFISLTKVLPAALALAKEKAQLVTLIKPQFEVGKAEVSRGKGVIRDPLLHQQVCADISAWVRELGWNVVGIATSPITGPKGNVEFLLYATKG